MAAKCDWGGCGNPGEFQIGLRLWAFSTPPQSRTTKNGLLMLTSVCVCRACSARVKPADFLLPEGKERIATGLLRAGKAPPDFTSAEIVLEPIVDAPIDLAAEARAARLAGGGIIEA